MDKAVFETEAVDEGLECRAWRAQCRGHVHRAGAALVEITRRADMGQHLAGRVVHDKKRERNIGPEPRCQAALALARQRLRSVFCSSASSVRRSFAPVAACATAWSAAGGASIGIGRRAVGTGSALANAISSGGSLALEAKRSSTRLRALRAAPGKRSGRRSSGDCGSATSSAAWASERCRGSLPKYDSEAARMPSILPP